MAFFIEIYDQIVLVERKKIGHEYLKNLCISILGKNMVIWDMEKHMFGKNGKSIQKSAEIALTILREKKSIIPIHNKKSKTRDVLRDETGCDYLEHFAWHLEEFMEMGKKYANCTFIKCAHSSSEEEGDDSEENICKTNGCYDNNLKRQKPGKCLYKTAVPCDEPDCMFRNAGKCSADCGD